MKYQTRAFQISFLAHSLIFVLVVIPKHLHRSPPTRLKVLDFQSAKAAAPGEKGRATSSDAGDKDLAAYTPKTSNLKKEPPRPQEEKPKAAPPLETPPMVKLPEAHSLDSRPVGLAIPDHVQDLKRRFSRHPGRGQRRIGNRPRAGNRIRIGNSDGAKESARTKYLKDHFAYIRDKILRNISYPDSARRMGWQGKVLLSFIISADGSVSEFKIIQGSGFPILDQERHRDR